MHTQQHENKISHSKEKASPLEQAQKNEKVMQTSLTQQNA
jgi:hypothetical protein